MSSLHAYNSHTSHFNPIMSPNDGWDMSFRGTDRSFAAVQKFNPSSSNQMNSNMYQHKQVPQAAGYHSSYISDLWPRDNIAASKNVQNQTGMTQPLKPKNSKAVQIPSEDFVEIGPSSHAMWSSPSSSNVPKKPEEKSLHSDSASPPPANIEDEITGQNLYKTELCRSFEENGTCRYGAKCQFAHGKHEIRQIIRHPKYKTEICKTFQNEGICPYGLRCRFIHHSSESNHEQISVPQTTQSLQSKSQKPQVKSHIPHQSQYSQPKFDAEARSFISQFNSLSIQPINGAQNQTKYCSPSPQQTQLYPQMNGMGVFGNNEDWSTTWNAPKSAMGATYGFSAPSPISTTPIPDARITSPLDNSFFVAPVKSSKKEAERRLAIFQHLTDSN
jgi:butyrate response factor 1